MIGPAEALRALIEAVAHAEPPPAVRQRAALVFADTIAAMAAGAGEDECRRLLGRPDPDGPCTVVGRKQQCSPERAAFLNGLIGTAAEFDEGNYRAGGHPAVQAIPAILAEGEARDAAGAAGLDALAIGYEIAARVGAATRLRDTVHSHGTWGGIAAAAATARLRGFGAEGFLAAINAAAQLAIAASRSSGLRGASIRNAFAGIAARDGLLACDLVEAGFTAEPDGAAIVFGQILGTAFEPAAMLDGLGDEWRITDNFFKSAASCRETHGALAAWADLAESHADGTPAPEDIIAVKVRSFAAAAKLGERHPATSLAARYSTPFTLASHIVHARTDAAAFRGENLRDARVAKVAACVTLEEDPGMTAALPEARLTEVTVVLRNGQARRGSANGSPGDTGWPMSDAALRDKFLHCGLDLWGSMAAAVWDTCIALGDLRIRDVAFILRSSQSSPSDKT